MCMDTMSQTSFGAAGRLKIVVLCLAGGLVGGTLVGGAGLLYLRARLSTVAHQSGRDAGARRHLQSADTRTHRVLQSPPDPAISFRSTKIASLDAPADEPRRSPPEPPIPQLAEELRDRFSGRLNEHQTEGYDHRWATQTQMRLTEELQGLQVAGQFHLKNVDCRTVTCVIEVEWPDFDTAKWKYRVLLENPLGETCAQEMILPPEGPGKVPARLLMDCTESRT